MNQDRPTQILLGGFTFKVCWMDKSWSEDSGRQGEISYNHHELRIRVDIPPEKIAAVFVHEVAHGLMWYYEYHNWPNREEAFAQCAAYGLQGFWKANPDAFRWWVGMMEWSQDDNKCEQWINSLQAQRAVGAPNDPGGLK